MAVTPLRREKALIIMLYRIVYHIVDIPAVSYLQPTSLQTRGHALRFLEPHTMTTAYKTFPKPFGSGINFQKEQKRPRP
jgi:hypothetical protein